MPVTLAAHKIALDPTAEQEVYFRKACGVARFAYNWALAEWKRMHEAGEKPTWQKLQKKLNAIKDEQFPWMREVVSYASTKAVEFLGHAYARFFDRKASQPRFKKKGVSQESFFAGKHEAARSIATDGRRVLLPRVGWVRVRQAVRFSGRIKYATVLREAGHWFVTLLIDTPDIRPVPAKAKRAACGVDLGVKTLATIDTGRGFEEVEGPKPHAALLDRLRRLSRSLSRKAKGSANRAKAKAKLARLHYRIRCIRADALHKLTTRLAKGFKVVGVEDLNVRGMVRNRRLARAIADGGFGEFCRQLAYKCEWYGSKLVVADRFFPSSKTCPDCGAVNKGLKLSDRFWTCPSCGAWLDRDKAAAENLRRLAVGQTVTACGADTGGGTSRTRRSTSRPAVKQEAAV